MQLARRFRVDAHASKLAHVTKHKTPIVVEVKNHMRVWQQLIVMRETNEFACHPQVRR